MDEVKPLADGEAELLEERLRNDIRLVPEALEEEFRKCPGHVAYWSARYAKAIGEHLRATARRKKLYGLLRIRARNELEDELDLAVAADTDDKPSTKPKRSGRQQITESMVDARVEQFPEWEDAQFCEIEAEVERERMRGAVEAMRAKKDMLVQCGANQRAEMDSNPMVRERMTAARNGRDY